MPNKSTLQLTPEIKIESSGQLREIADTLEEMDSDSRLEGQNDYLNALEKASGILNAVADFLEKLEVH